MKRLKVILGALVVLLVAALVAGYAALVSLDLESYRGTIEQRAQTATGRQLQLTGPMNLEVDFSPAIAVEGVRFANADWGTGDAMATVERFELEVALLPLITGEVKIRRLVLVEPRILLETDAQGRGNWVLSPEDADGATEDRGTGGGSGLRGLNVQSVVVENGLLTYRDGRTGEELKLALRSAVLRRDGGDDLDVEVDGGYQNVPFELTGSVGQLARLASGTGRYPVDLTLAAVDTTVSMTGALDQSAPDLRPDLELRVAGERLADLSPLVDVALPDAGPFELKTRLRGEAKGYVLSGLQAKVADSDLSGEATLKVTGPRPALSGEFKAARLDLPGLLPKGQAAEAGAEASSDRRNRRLFPDTPLPLDALQAIDADLRLDVGALRLADGVSANEVALGVRLSEGRLDVQPLDGQLAGGRLTANLSLESAARPSTLALRVDARDVDYGRLLREMGVSEEVTGQLSARADLRGAGATPHAIAGSLAGRFEVIGDEGRVANSALRTAGAGLSEVLAPWREDSEGMRINCVVARFEVRDGIAESRAILADTQDVTLAGDGSIDLGEEVYDLRLVPKAKRTSLASLAVPMRVSGPLTSPNVGPDPLGAAKAGAIAIGSLVNPLVTLGALILESETADENPCVAALREASSDGGADQQGGAGDGESGSGLGGFLEGLGQSIDKQLGSEGDDSQDVPTFLQDGGGADR